jgi:hypothetical protein
MTLDDLYCDYCESDGHTFRSCPQRDDAYNDDSELEDDPSPNGDRLEWRQKGTRQVTNPDPRGTPCREPGCNTVREFGLLVCGAHHAVANLTSDVSDLKLRVANLTAEAADLRRQGSALRLRVLDLVAADDNSIFAISERAWILADELRDGDEDYPAA